MQIKGKPIKIGFTLAPFRDGEVQLEWSSWADSARTSHIRVLLPMFTVGVYNEKRYPVR